jgi:hypothetical protein
MDPCEADNSCGFSPITSSPPGPSNNAPSSDGGYFLVASNADDGGANQNPSNLSFTSSAGGVDIYNSGLYFDSLNANLKISKPQSGPCGSHPILGALGKVWNSPNTLLGLAAAGASYVAGKYEGTNPTFQLGNNSIQLLNSPLNVGNRAYTLGNVQVYGSSGPDRGQISYSGAFVNNGQHEEGHTVQGQILGPLYLPAWGLGRLFGGDSAGNPMEAGADKYGLGQSCSGF